MTLIVGFSCSDGVVLAADSMLTANLGQLATGHHRGRKVHVLRDRQIYAFAGNIGQAERLRLMADSNFALTGAIEHPLDYGLKLSASVIQQITQTGIMASKTLDLAAFLAYPFAGRIYCCAFEGVVQPRLLDAYHFYGALGSDKQYADPFLRFLVDIFCKRQPTVSEAVFLSTWTLDHVIKTNAGGVAGPIAIVTLQHQGRGVVAKELADHELQDQRQAIFDAERSLRDWRDRIAGLREPDSDTPPVPTLERHG